MRLVLGRSGAGRVQRCSAVSQGDDVYYNKSEMDYGCKPLFFNQTMQTIVLAIANKCGEYFSTGYFAQLYIYICFLEDSRFWEEETNSKEGLNATIRKIERMRIQNSFSGKGLQV